MAESGSGAGGWGLGLGAGGSGWGWGWTVGFHFYILKENMANTKQIVLINKNETCGLVKWF